MQRQRQYAEYEAESHALAKAQRVEAQQQHQARLDAEGVGRAKEYEDAVRNFEIQRVALATDKQAFAMQADKRSREIELAAAALLAPAYASAEAQALLPSALRWHTLQQPVEHAVAEQGGFRAGSSTMLLPPGLSAPPLHPPSS